MEVQHIGSSDNVQDLTTEELILFCQSQLNDLNQEIEVLLAAQTSAINQKDMVARLENMLKGTPAPSEGSQIAKFEDAYNEVIDALPEGFIRNELIRIRDESLEPIKQLAAEHSHFNVNWAHWRSTLAEVGRLKERISGDAELRMIKVQSYVSKRQSAIQLTTNLMSKFNQSLNSVTKNV